MKKVLILGSQSADYLNVMLLNGLLDSKDVQLSVFPSAHLVNESYSDELKNKLRGNGFSIFFEHSKSPEIIIEIHEALKNIKFDTVIISDIFNNFYLTYLVDLYRKNFKHLVVIDGSDSTNLFPYQKSLFGLKHIFLLPKFHKTAIYFKREYTEETLSSVFFFKMPNFICKFLYKKRYFRNIHPISFSISNRKIINPETVTKTKLFPGHIVDAEVAKNLTNTSENYLFTNEEDYYLDIQKSKFGITTKRSGWDCLRHYEIAANACVLCFKNLDKKPIHCAPHDLVPGLNCLSYTNYQDLMEQIKKISDDDYNDLLMRTHEWIKSKSSVNLADHILTKSS